MKKIYFTRHGQTVWNVENKICGATDIALTEYGHAQAAALGRNIAAALKGSYVPSLPRNMKIDEILYSPLVRAAETARHIMKRFVKCFFKLLTQNFISAAGDGQEKGRKTRLWAFKRRFRRRDGNGKNPDGQGVRVEIFSRPLRKNTTRPLTVWIVGTDIKQGLFLVRRCAIFYN